LLAHRSILGTLVSRSESDLCRTERCSPWPTPFPPQPPLKRTLRCSAGSSVLWRGPTPLKRAYPHSGFGPFRAGLDLDSSEALQRSPGSRALFLSVRGFLDYAGPAGRSRLSRPTVLPSPLRQKVGILKQRFFEAQSPGPPIVGIELRRAGCRWRVTNSLFRFASWCLISTVATFPKAPR